LEGIKPGKDSRMTTKEVIRDVIDFAHRVTHGYLSDFADGDLLVRPLPEMNHTAWQIGHLICSEHSMMTRIGITMPDLPPGFAGNYTDQTSRSDDRQLFATKAEYFTLWDASRAAIFTALDSIPPAKLAEPTPESMHPYARTVAAVFRHVGTHELMHVGQFAAARRKLDKPVLI